MQSRLVLAAVAVAAGCSRPPPPSRPITTQAAAIASSAKVPSSSPARVEPILDGCGGEVAVVAGGRRTGKVCRADVARRGLVLVDLADDWTPIVLRGAGGTAPG